jgi:hypothetical protein
LLPLHHALLPLLLVVAVLQAALLPWLRRPLLPPRLQLQLWPMWGPEDGLPCRQVVWGPCTWTASRVGLLGQHQGLLVQQRQQQQQQAHHRVRLALTLAPQISTGSGEHRQTCCWLRSLLRQLQQQQQRPAPMLMAMPVVRTQRHLQLLLLTVVMRSRHRLV